MKVILLEDVPNLGKKGEVVQVANGYARNYLFPRRLATEATEGKIKELMLQKTATERKKQREKTEAEELAVRLDGLLVHIPAKAGKNGKLFGSISNKDIADALWQEHAIKIDKKKIILKEPMKRLGRYSLVIKLYPEIQAQITIEVKPTEQS